MKINKIICAAVAAGAIVLSANSVFAADSLKLGKFYDLTTGAETSDLVVGHSIAVPFDIVSDTDGVTSFELKADYDNSVLKAGFSLDSLTQAEINNLVALDDAEGDNLVIDANNKAVGIGLLKVKGAIKESYIGGTAYVANASYAADSTFMTTANAKTMSTKADCEGYLLFKVIAEPTSTKLNTSVVEIDPAKSLIADANNSKAPIYNNTENSTEAKSNACAGAIKINIDSNALKDAGLYLHGLQVKVGSGSAVNVLDLIDNGDGTYSFPIRFINDSNAPITTLTGVKLIAKVAETETADTYEEKTSTLEDIALNAPTDYANTSATIS